MVLLQKKKTHLLGQRGPSLACIWGQKTVVGGPCSLPTTVCLHQAWLTSTLTWWSSSPAWSSCVCLPNSWLKVCTTTPSCQGSSPESVCVLGKHPADHIASPALVTCLLTGQTATRLNWFLSNKWLFIPVQWLVPGILALGREAAGSGPALVT